MAETKKSECLVKSHLIIKSPMFLGTQIIMNMNM